MGGTDHTGTGWATVHDLPKTTAIETFSLSGSLGWCTATAGHDQHIFRLNPSRPHCALLRMNRKPESDHLKQIVVAKKSQGKEFCCAWSRASSCRRCTRPRFINPVLQGPSPSRRQRLEPGQQRLRSRVPSRVLPCNEDWFKTRCRDSQQPWCTLLHSPKTRRIVRTDPN